MNHFLNFLKGACMGAADVVPGVSGGTVALLVGIYERLIRAISSFNSELIGLIRQKKFRQILDHIDWKFLFPLAMGLVTGFIITIKTIGHYLEIDSSRSLIMAAFFGMIIAATIIVARMVGGMKNGNTGKNWALAAVGMALSLSIFFWQLNRGEVMQDPSLVYLFFCGAIAICAMILPGISGALILILLGVYEPLVAKVKAFLKFEDFGSNFVVCVCFGLGMVTGLALFSRVLNRLLDRHATATLSVLCGLMCGSLPLLWPFQVNTTPGVEEVKERIYKPILPEAFDSHFWKHATVVLLAIAAIMIAEFLSRRTNRSKAAVG